MKGEPQEYKLSPEARDHLEKYWRLSLAFFDKADYALASFFAVTLIEEVGKIVLLFTEGLKQSGDKELSDKETKNFQKALKSHHEKYVQAAGYTLYVNSRVSRIYGADEYRFAGWVKDGRLFGLRNDGLYLEVVDDELRAPLEAVSREDALLLVCMAGEVYADVQGFATSTGPEEHFRLIREVDAFREKNQRY